MRQPELFYELQRALSNSRLEPYLAQNPRRNMEESLGIYLWNLALCESLYPSLHGIEVALRNSIHDAASEKFNDEFWFKSQLVGYERDTIERMGDSFSSRNIEATSGKYISECNFGFWVSLFNSKYEQILWRSLLREVFPHAPRWSRTRSTVRDRLDGIRRLRNRVFHFEPIWGLPDLQRQHGDILETIGWINPAFQEMMRLVDRFPQVFDDGAIVYQAKVNVLSQRLQTVSNAAAQLRGNKNE